jgi:MtN3 and saliva related transmembrane protein
MATKSKPIQSGYCDVGRSLAYRESSAEERMGRFNRVTHAVLLLSLITLCGCQDLVPHDTSSLFLPRFLRSEIIGFLAGLGTTFASVPDLVTMLKRRSSTGINPRMAAIMGVFQILWVYYGLLILSRPVIAWNVIAVAINFLTVGAYFRFARSKRNQAKE